VHAARTTPDQGSLPTRKPPRARRRPRVFRDRRTRASPA
jgi:hypothetical protein